MRSDLIERLRAEPVMDAGDGPFVELWEADRDALVDALEEALKVLAPFANVAARIREAAQDERWLEQILFYMGSDDDPTKWSLSGRAFDAARDFVGRWK